MESVRTAPMTLGHRFIATVKRHPAQPLMSDPLMRFTMMDSLIAARLLSRWLQPQLRDQNIGVLMPATTGGVLANLALALLGKTSVNLNHTLGEAALEQAIAKAGITRIITARKVIEKLEIAPRESMIYFEDAGPAIGKLSKIMTWLAATFSSAESLARCWLAGEQAAHAPATILFSSGSTSTPKGVVLSHAGMLANIDALDSLLRAEETRDGTPLSLAGILPFFHSFGLTVGLWLPAITARRIAYHPNPLEAKGVVRMIAKEKPTMMIATPTFAKHYVAAAKDHALASLKLLILGGEKLGEAVEKSLRDALPGTHVLQGYGTTELGPVVAINTPSAQATSSVGRPLPGIEVKAMDLDTGEELPAGRDGLLLVKSPACMEGYYHDHALTGEVMEHGWYVTGDIGHVDANGFLYITDRLARFSKIGGEMVPHGKIEAALEGIVGAHNAAVVAVPDARKGERICALITGSEKPPAEIQAELKTLGLPNLWIPSVDAIYRVEALPILATGKLDLRACKRMVMESAEQKAA